jgi:hypothetical protein
LELIAMTNANSATVYASYDSQREHLCNHARAAGIEEACIKPVLDHLLPRYTEADETAIRYQRAFNRAAAAVYCLSALAVSVAVVQLLFVPELHQLIVIEVLAMLAALILIYVGRRGQWKYKWLNARHLAERIRGTMYTSVISGKHASGRPDPSAGLRFYRGLDEQLMQRTREAVSHEQLRHCQCDNVEAVRRFIVDAWILDQAVYHKNVAKKKHRAARRTHVTMALLFVATLAAATVHTAGVGHGAHEGYVTAGLAVGLVSILFTIALPAWASALHGINDLLDRERIATRSQGMAAVLREQAEQAASAETIEDLREIAAYVEWLSATENHEWLISLGFRRPPPVPA